MKRLFLHFALLVVATICALSCNKNDFGLVTVSDSNTLYARVQGVDTKVGFEDNNDSGIALTWELDDTFSVYDTDGSYVGDYYCIDVESEAFSPKSSFSLVDDASYTAIYPAVDNSEAVLSLTEARARDLTSKQDGDAIVNLDAACYMEASFTYSAKSNITVNFEHQMAIMSFTFISDQRPYDLVFTNGSDSYIVNYSTISPSIIDGNDYYTSHIMIKPCEAKERTLVFELYGSDGLYDNRDVTTSKAYKAGVRYNAPISDLMPWLGSGTEGDPYKITTADHLRQLSTYVNAGNQYSGEYFVMTHDINLGYNLDSTYFKDEKNKFTPIGNTTSSTTSFRGTFDGGGHEVVGLYINNPDGCSGLFGNVYEATIKNLRVDGVISGKDFVGGIVGYGRVTIENCCNKALVSSDGDNLGGILGYANGSPSYHSNIINCYNSRKISSSGSNVGGIVGYGSYCNVTNSYNSGEVSSLGSNVGGIVGDGDMCGTISICYNSANVSGSSNSGSILGTRSPYEGELFTTTVSNCYYLDSSSDDYAEKISDERMKSADFVVYLNNLVYEYNQSTTGIKAYGWAQETNDYPVLDPDIEVVYIYDMEYDTSTNAYLINTKYGLKAFADLANGNANTCDAAVKLAAGTYFGFVTPCNGLLTADIDLSTICSSSAGNWEPIGKSTTTALFSGTFDGGGYSISGLYIGDSSSDNLGLFGYVGIEGIVKNISFSGSISGSTYIGGIAGVNYGTIINCNNNSSQVVSGYSEGVYGSEHIGGIVGHNFGVITNCYDIGYVSGNNSVGGIVGCNEGGVVTNCYKSLYMAANGTAGGIVGYMHSGTVTNCYYDSYCVSYGYGGVYSDDEGVTKMSTTEMKESSFALKLYNNAYNYNLVNPTATQACAWIVSDNVYPALEYNVMPTSL